MNQEFLPAAALYSFYVCIAALAAGALTGWALLLSPAGWAGGRSEAAPSAEFANRLGRWALRAGLAALSLSLVARGVAAQRPPFGSQYEFAIAFAWAALGVALVVERGERRPGLWFAASVAALLVLVYASTLPSALLPPVPALQNRPLLALHVGAAVLAYGANAAAFAGAAMYLLQRAALRRRWRLSRALPPLRTSDELSYRAVMIGFPMLGATLLFGSWWASIAWGFYWNWDPKETATLATWLVYGVYLHARIRRSWQGPAGAWLLVLGFALTLFTYAGNTFFNSLHSYSGL